VGKPPERTLNSDFLHGRKISIIGSEIMDNKPIKQYICACSNSMLLLIYKSIFKISKSLNINGIIIVINDNIAIYTKHNIRIPAYVVESE
jgi:hypothetical protein